MDELFKAKGDYECICPSTKPTSYVITPGYHYSASAGVANNCIAPCPVGDYCPGTRPDSPDQPIVDPIVNVCKSDYHLSGNHPKIGTGVWTQSNTN